MIYWDLLAFGLPIIEIGLCIDNLELELIVHAVHVCVCEDYREVPGPEIPPLRRVVGQLPPFLVYTDKFIDFFLGD